MKKLFFFLSVVGLTTTQLFAQRVVEDNFAALKVHYSTPELSVKACDGIASGHVVLGLDGYVSGGTVGSPACPVLSSYIEVPFCDELRVSVENAVFDTVDLGRMPVIPMQPSRSKSDRSEPTLVKNASVYATDAFVGSELAEGQYVGIARDRNLALLSFSPVSVNPVTGKAIVCRSADVTVSYVGGDEQYTRQYYSRYHTPAFCATTTINSILSIAGGLKQYDHVKVITGGGPGGATQTITLMSVEKAFEYNRRGYSSAIILVLFVLIVIVSAVQLSITKRREVKY